MEEICKARCTEFSFTSSNDQCPLKRNVSWTLSKNGLPLKKHSSVVIASALLFYSAAKRFLEIGRPFSVSRSSSGQRKRNNTWIGKVEKQMYDFNKWWFRCKLKRRRSLARFRYKPTRLWGFSGHVQTIVHSVIGRVRCPWPIGERVYISLPDESTLTYDLYQPLSHGHEGTYCYV